MYFAILDNVDEIENRGDIRKCLSRFEEIVKIGISDDIGIEYFENLNEHIKDLTNREERIPFNWTEWDRYTYGGIPKNEPCLFMLMAQPGLGKSMFMMNIGYQYLLQNLNVLMVSLEMSEQMYARRMSALFSDINVNELKDHTEVLKKRVSTTKLSIPSARLYIKQYSPNEFNSIKLKSLLHKLQETKKFVPDLIIVDYLNIMSTNGPSYHMKSYERVGAISKELRSVSIETKLPILSATQSNRSGAGGYAGEDISMNNTSDSASINMDADALFALYQLEGERELGRVNVKILKNRLGGYVDTIFPMTVNYDTLKISDWGSETDDELDTEIFNNSNQQVKQKTTDSSEIDTLFENLG
jgi:replicative DNA helicase